MPVGKTGTPANFCLQKESLPAEIRYFYCTLFVKKNAIEKAYKDLPK